MLVKDMILSTDFDDVWEQREVFAYSAQAINSSPKCDAIEMENLRRAVYKNVWNKLLELEPIVQDKKYLIGAEYFDCLDPKFVPGHNMPMEFDVSMYSYDDNEIYSFLLTKWEEVLGLEVAPYCLNRYGAVKLCAHLLYEITFFGFDYNQVLSKQDAIVQDLKTAEKDIMEGRLGISFEDFMQKWEKENGDNEIISKKELNSDVTQNKINKYMELNKEITDTIIESIRKNVEKDIN